MDSDYITEDLSYPYPHAQSAPVFENVDNVQYSKNVLQLSKSFKAQYSSTLPCSIVLG